VEEKIFVPNFVFRDEAVSPPSAPLIEEEPNVLGLFKNYLFVIEQGVIVLDLKGAYEHVVYMETSSSPTSQGLLFPVSLDLPGGEGKIFEARLPEIEKAGFSVRPMGKDLFIIEAIPSFLHADEAVDAVHTLLEGDVSLKLSLFAGQKKSDFVLQEAIALWKKVRTLGPKAKSPQGNLIFVQWSIDELQKLFRS
jgi:DNA mismatch repair ATPase MutL